MADEYKELNNNKLDTKEKTTLNENPQMREEELEKVSGGRISKPDREPGDYR